VRKRPRAPFGMLSVCDDDDHVVDAICAGASGHLLKTTVPARLLESLTEVVTGGAPMSPGVALRAPDLCESRPPPFSSYQLRN
jgi:DNA-binding NarL/FixJ family response regulator